MKAITKSAKLEMNLNALSSEHREKGRPLRGYNKLVRAIRGNRENYLKRMLRNYLDEPIEMPSEIAFRDEVDYLLKYYSLLQIAIMTGYVSPQLTPELKSEIVEILGNKYVRQYYKDFYGILLPDIFYAAIKNHKKQKVIGESKHFLELLLLDKNVDNDVENFLWLLDSGSFDDYSIWSLRKTLQSRSKVESILKKPRKDEDEADSAFWGFIKYTTYLQQYESLLRKCEDDLLRSVLWHYQSYWFEKMKRLMNDIYVPAIKDIYSINKGISYSSFRKRPGFTIVSSSLTKKELDVNNRKYFNSWKIDSEEQYKKVLNSVNYNLDSTHSESLVNYFNIKKGT